MRRTWDHPAYPRPRDSPVTSSLRQHERLAGSTGMPCLPIGSLLVFSSSQSIYAGSRLSIRHSFFSRRVHVRCPFLEFSNEKHGEIVARWDGAGESSFSPIFSAVWKLKRKFLPSRHVSQSPNAFPSCGYNFDEKPCRRVESMRPLFPFFFPFSRVKRARQTPPPNITRATVHHISSVCVCVCARVHVSCTRERDIRAYVRVALICAHFTIIVRDRIVVGWPWRLCPALLRQLFCYSDGVRVFVLNGARVLPFATARYSVFVVGSSRKSNDLKSYAATPTTADSTRGFSSSNATYVSQREWNEIVSKGKETI